MYDLFTMKELLYAVFVIGSVLVIVNLMVAGILLYSSYVMRDAVRKFRASVTRDFGQVINNEILNALLDKK